MNFILPGDFKKFQQSLKSKAHLAELTVAFHKMETYIVDAYIPKFTTETTVPLKDVLMLEIVSLLFSHFTC